MQLELNSNTWNGIKMQLNSIKIVLYSNSIEKKWDAKLMQKELKNMLVIVVLKTKKNTHTNLIFKIYV